MNCPICGNEYIIGGSGRQHERCRQLEKDRVTVEKEVMVHTSSAVPPHYLKLQLMKDGSVRWKSDNDSNPNYH